MQGKKLEKVVSTTLSKDDFILLERYARDRYNRNWIAQPTISHMLRFIVVNWAKKIRDKEQEVKSSVHINPFQSPDNAFRGPSTSR